jgi:primosomal protein N' (replication factor Y)
MNLIAKIIVPNLDPLDYLTSENLNKGDLVIVPFRSKKLIGMVWETNLTTEVSLEKLKSIEKKINLSISEVNVEFITWVANYYLFSLGHVFKMLMPTQISNFLLKEKACKEITDIKLKYTSPEFHPKQLEAISRIETLINDKQSIILDGVTGSGKTEIYLAAIAKILKQQDAQALIILPEISLTSQIIDRISKRFGTIPYIWHSSITDKNKRDSFMAVAIGKAKIIIGARSALFLPYKNLQIIIIDEEHEQSYKQEDGVTYQARDMAIMRAKLANIPIILASASPSLESIYNISLGKLNLVPLDVRYNDNVMPKVHIIDMKKERKRGYFIAPSLIVALKENLDKGQQSLLFLNRKGYAPSMICGDCGYKISCKFCSTGMIYHKSQKKLKCHQCGYVAAIPKTCPSCANQESFTACGPGIERLAEELNELIPKARLISLTQDNLSNPKHSSGLLQDITDRNCDIILGTQVVAKGHHFPALTLVGVIDADSGMIGGDLRAAEKNYQLLQQVGGRAGREIENSKIFIQTYNPQHPLILAIANYDREKFITEEMRTREVTNMPPFGRLAGIIISSKQEAKLVEFTKDLVKMAPSSKEITVLGPAPALIYKLRGKFRYRILIKCKRNINIQKFLNTWLASFKIPSYLHMKIDIDPYHFL